MASHSHWGIQAGSWTAAVIKHQAGSLWFRRRGKKRVIITHFASRARAMIPAASGAEADVPVCESVHLDLRSVVTCVTQTRRMNKSASPRTKAVGKCWFFTSGYSSSCSVQPGKKQLTTDSNSPKTHSYKSLTEWLFSSGNTRRELQSSCIVLHCTWMENGRWEQKSHEPIMWLLVRSNLSWVTQRRTEAALGINAAAGITGEASQGIKAILGKVINDWRLAGRSSPLQR